MPWQETNPVLERRHFIQDVRSGHWKMSELCLRYGVSRVTGYKWLDRYQQGGEAFLLDQSRAPRTSPGATAPELVKLILEENSRYGWGARKVRKRLLSPPSRQGLAGPQHDQRHPLAPRPRAFPS